MIIAGLQKTTLIDYPGKLACTVFLVVCNFRCPWCYNSELVLPAKIIKHPRVSEKEFFSFLKKRKGLLEGVCVTGGEPTINKDLPEFMSKIKKMGYSVKLDTNGSNPVMLKDLINKKLIDYAAMDIKAPLDHEIYQNIMGEGVKLENIKKSVEIIKNSKIDGEFRTTVVPEIHKKDDFVEIAKWIGGKDVEYYLQNFRPEKTIDPEFEKIKPYSEKFLQEIVNEIKSYFKKCLVR